MLLGLIEMLLESASQLLRGGSLYHFGKSFHSLGFSRVEILEVVNVQFAQLILFRFAS
jgi:hypothetical protein